jgi:hypothetical protein
MKGDVRLAYLGPSSRPSKKLAAIFLDGDGGSKTVHFGGAGYGDFTTHWARDRQSARSKRKQYIRRHSVHEDWGQPAAAGTLSRYILWEKPTVREAVRAFKRRFGV